MPAHNFLHYETGLATTVPTIRKGIIIQR